MKMILVCVALAGEKKNVGKLPLVKPNVRGEAASAKPQNMGSNCTINQFVHHREFGFGLVQPASPAFQTAFDLPETSGNPADRCFVYYFHPARHAPADRGELTNVESPRCHSYGNCATDSLAKRKHIQMSLCVGQIFQGQRIYGLRPVPGRRGSYQVLTSLAGLHEAFSEGAGDRGAIGAREIQQTISAEDSVVQRQQFESAAERTRQNLTRHVFNFQTVDFPEMWEQERVRILTGGGAPQYFTVSDYSQNAVYDRQGDQNASCPPTAQERDVRMLRKIEGPQSSESQKGVD